MPKNVPVKIKPHDAIQARLLRLHLWSAAKAELLGEWLSHNWFRLLIIALLTLILLRKDVSLQLDLQNGPPPVQQEKVSQTISLLSDSPEPMVVSQSPELSARVEKQRAYVDRFAEVARQEMVRYGIPASITLGQGLLETDAGESPLASRYNNHFGLKCFSRSCAKGHCFNFSDDSHKDFFRNFSNAWESFRAHSLLLVNGERYQSLFDLPKTDYKAWAEGLNEAGYATDKRYGQKLIRLIEALGLDDYDV